MGYDGKRKEIALVASMPASEYAPTRFSVNTKNDVNAENAKDVLPWLLFYDLIRNDVQRVFCETIAENKQRVFAVNSILEKLLQK